MDKLFVLNEERNVTLNAMIQPLSPELGYIKERPAVLVIPGGGYRMCSDREAELIAYGYMHMGFSAFVLKYSVGKHAIWPNPLCDYEQAMELISEHASEWHIALDKIAVVGFSAGAHLALTAASESEYKPAAAVLCYPALNEKFWKSFDDAMGDGIKVAGDAIEKVNENTSPCFVFATRNDNLVHVDNSVELLSALVKFGVPFESHIYSCGQHGVSICDSSVLAPGSSYTPRAKNWFDDSIAWLREVMGDFGNGKFTEPLVSKKK